MNEIKTPRWRDAHLHLRQGDATDKLGPYSSAWCSDAVVMPNTDPPIETAEQLTAYREHCQRALGPTCTPLMTAFLGRNMTAETVRGLGMAGCVALKVYPDEQTTNSHGGLTRSDFLRGPAPRLDDVMLAAQELNMMVLWHGEVPGDEIQDQEANFCYTLERYSTRYPNLRMVMEHISTAEGVDTVKRLRSLGLPVAGTITMHHPWFKDGLTSVMRPKCKPDWICMPLAKRRRDTLALLSAMADDGFFLGTDSAAHTQESKYCNEICAGCFTSPHPEMLIQLMEESGLLDYLTPFTSLRMGRFHRLGSPVGEITWKRSPWRVGSSYSGYVPFLARQPLGWQMVR